MQNSQTEDGKWIDSSYGSEPGVLGMAVLAFLSRGDDPEFGPFSKPLVRSIEQILRLQNKETGYIGNSMYNHGFATLALAEYYGLTNNTDIGPALKATNLIVSAQKTNPKGAWWYSPESKDADTTITELNWWPFLLPKMRESEFDEAIAKGKQFIDCQDEKGGFDTMVIPELIFSHRDWLTYLVP